MRRSLLQVGVVAALLVPAAMPSAQAESRIPLPLGVRTLPEPVTVETGSGTMQVNTFVSHMSAETLIRFYESALTEAGWELGLLPWQANHAQATKRFEKAMTLYGSQMDKDQRRQMTEQLEGYQRTARRMRQQIYATRGKRHLIVNLWPTEAGGTVVFLNRWSGNESVLFGERPQAKGVSAARPGEFGGSNVCCSGEEVAELTEALPHNLPRYPGATALARATPPEGSGTTLLLMAPAEATAVADFYRTHMKKEGWSLQVPEAQPEDVASSKPAYVQTYEKSGRVCYLTMHQIQQTDTEPREPQTMLLVSFP